jgi:hypothetical protein
MSVGLWRLQESVGEAAKRAEESSEWSYLKDRLSETVLKASLLVKLLSELGLREPQWLGSSVKRIREGVRAGDVSLSIEEVSLLEERIESKYRDLWVRAMHARLVRAGAGAALSLLSFKAYTALAEAGPLLLLAVALVASLGLSSLLLIRTYYSALLQAVAGLAALAYSMTLAALGMGSSIYWPSLISGLAGVMSFLYTRMVLKEVGDGLVG